jgi:hypothetical protein
MNLEVYVWISYDTVPPMNFASFFGGYKILKCLPYCIYSLNSLITIYIIKEL